MSEMACFASSGVWVVRRAGRATIRRLAVVRMAARPVVGPNLDEEQLLKDRGYRAGDRVVLFDGVCNMCNFGVNTVMQLDKRDQFKYASLQGDVGQALAKKFGCPTDLSTMIYIDGEKAHLRSEAILRIGQRMNFIATPSWLLLMGVPRSVRDWMYDNMLAKYRYEFFGKRDVCRLPTAEERAKFLDLTG